MTRCHPKSITTLPYNLDLQVVLESRGDFTRPTQKNHGNVLLQVVSTGLVLFLSPAQLEQLELTKIMIQRRNDTTTLLSTLTWSGLVFRAAAVCGTRTIAPRSEY